MKLQSSNRKNINTRFEQKQSKIETNIKEWLNNFNLKYKNALRELASR